MKKVILALALVLVIVVASVSFVACSNEEANDDYVYKAEKEAYVNAAKTSLTVGAIMVGDRSEGYTKAHMDGIDAAAAAVQAATGKTITVNYKTRVEEDSSCAVAAEELITAGAQLIITNSYGHEFPIRDTIWENPQVMFVSMTGDLAAVSKWSNWKNAFTNVYESRYVSGVVAGLKLKELIDNGQVLSANKDADGNIKIGYVGAFPYAEVVSGYTAFYLGIKSVVSNVKMTVKYTNSWFDIAKENETAQALIADGCIIIGQHADSQGAPKACEAKLTAGTLAYSVGYNVSMLGDAPTAALTSASNVWEKYYTYLFTKMLAGEEVATDWHAGYADGAVEITELGASCAAGTAAKVQETIDAIKDGSLKVFDCSKFTVNGANLTSYTSAYGMGGAECIKTVGEVKFFDESTLRSAPYFDIRIDGITEI